SALYRFKPDIVLIATHWRDADLPAFTDEPERFIERTGAEFSGLWRTLLGGRACRIIQHGFDLPPDDAYGHLGSVRPGGRAAMLRGINQRLIEAAPAAVALLDLDRASADYGRSSWEDPQQWFVAKQYPAAG